LEKKSEIEAFLIELKQHAEQWKKLKIVFLGHGEVGKTTFLNAIKQIQDWKRSHESTLLVCFLSSSFTSCLLPAFLITCDIIQSLCESYSLPLLFCCCFLMLFCIQKAPPPNIDQSDRTVGVEVSTMEIGTGEASVWDFGGQLEYAVTHQFLLSIEVCLNWGGLLKKEDFNHISNYQTKRSGTTI
jgi:GTPase SAR1 family protein